ncbi:DUF2269 family protein [Pseudomonas syringae]|uniref:DUF2269 family protein n=1 Tax=Pseudomonas syringae TaxID=317 RepID=UPI001372D2B2|nr:DUF2269 domain-containing protein [Pseudomonas syringae pv. actinidifoliorum]MDU8520438.1 DUF2269 domain-containing protein [Pseudomonas syringae pv. actinidifoliorum]MDU8524819.1 DUF2269 domain-containing protein [Pseudomonas syringae pv. actinidifoliorum]NAT25556.1 DUF2269 domain-containing protein [Pseudomonas syringae pv. actinidifoliorum]NAT38405.1 DUF2269 domain-containing protein [Pseudomonas syringae pv. actinidifoliorum]
MLYLYLKYLHVIAAIFLFGFGMGSYLYLIAASRSGNPVVIAHVARMVVRFDTWVTTPAGFVQVITGYAMVRLTGMALLTDWIITSLIIFACVGALWLPVLILQKRLERLANHAVAMGSVINDQFRSVYRLWFWLGVIGFSGMFLIVLMMVVKTTPMQFLQP